MGHCWTVEISIDNNKVSLGFFSQIKKALGALVVFDITSRKSFQSLDYWLGQLKEKALENVSVMLVGNKMDRAQYRDVSQQEAE